MVLFFDKVLYAGRTWLSARQGKRYDAGRSETKNEAVVAQERITKDELLKAMPLDRETKKENLQFYIPELGGVKELEINSIKRNDRTYW